MPRHRIKASLYKLETTVDVDEVNRSEAVGARVVPVEGGGRADDASRRAVALADFRVGQCVSSARG